MNPPVLIQPIAERFPAREEQEVVLTLFAPMAKDVQVAGTFNGWRPEATRLARSESGEWEVTLRLRSGRYEYRFVIDGVWTDDVRAMERVPNGLGEFNSVVQVGLDDRTDLL